MQPHEILETELATWSGVPHAVACSSGTAALHLALEALQLPRFTCVAIPDYTMVACARAVSLAGLTPVLIGCKPDWTMDPTQLWRAARSAYRISAIMPVHVYGRRCDMEAIMAAARYLGAPVVEDSAEAHGVPPHKDTAAVCWSFYKNKIVHGEEGGAVGFKDPRLAERARQLRCLGFSEAHDYRHAPRGCNYRLAPSLATKVLSSLMAYPGEVANRRRMEAEYNKLAPTPPRNAPWVYDLRSERAAAAVRKLNASGIAARVGFVPMSLQEEYRSCSRFGECPDWESVLHLPLTGPFCHDLLSCL